MDPELCTPGNLHVEMRTEIRIMLLEATDRWRWPANHQKLGKRQAADSLSWSLGETIPVDILISDL